MEELKIQDGKFYLNEHEIKGVTDYEIKGTAEKGYAEVKLTLLAKLS